MKKLLALIMSVLMILCVFASCAKTDDTKDAGKTETLSKEEIFEKAMSSANAVENSSYSATIALDADLMGENVVLNAELDMAASMKNKIIFADLFIDVMGEEIEAQSYISYGENPGTYTQVFGEWIREPLPAEALSLYEDMMANQAEAVNKLSKYMKVISAEETEYNGKAAYEIKIEYDMDIPAILGEFGISLEDVFSEELFGQEEIALYYALFEDLGSVEMTQHVDKESFLPLDESCDMTAMAQKLVDKIVAFVAEMEGLSLEEMKELGFEIKVNKLLLSAGGFNYDIPELTLPAEALEAELIGEEDAIGIIGGADGPTEVIVAEPEIA